MSHYISSLIINAAHSSPAHVLAYQTAEDWKIDLIFLTEPYNYLHKPLHLPFSWTSFHSESRNCSVIIRNPNINASYCASTLHSVSITLPYNCLSITFISVYLPPNGDISADLVDLAKNLTEDGIFIICGDFNCKSTHWGYSVDDSRGRLLCDFLVEHDLSPCNIPSQGPTFTSADGRCGCPDLTIVSTRFIHLISDWLVRDHDSLSDHRYITFNISSPSQHFTDFVFKTNYSLGKFHRHFRSHFHYLNHLCTNINSTSDIDFFTTSLVSATSASLFRTTRKKPLRPHKPLIWWTPSLAKRRNYLTALRRRINACVREGLDPSILSNLKTFYSRERAVYRSLITTTRRNSWISYCSSISSPFGQAFRTVFQRHSSINNLTVSVPNTPNPSLADRVNYLLNYHFPPDNDDPLTYIPTFNHPIPSDFSLSIYDLKLILRSLPNGKAPGPDRLDNKIWKLLFSNYTSFFLSYFNSCFSFNYFPVSLRTGKVIFINKPDKDPSLPSNYRPICLLPTLGKILEKAFLLKFNFWLTSNNIISPHQFGFREGGGCELALHHLLRQISILKSTSHLALVSLDMKAAFDHIAWNILFQIFSNINLPYHFRNFISSYFTDRSICFTTHNTSYSRSVKRGCPQGSVIAPFLWNLYINDILNLSFPDFSNFYISAFADDITFLVPGTTRKILENNTNTALQSIYLFLLSRDLTLSLDKCKALVFRHLPRFSKFSHTFNKRNPIFKCHNHTIKIVENIKILGLIINNKLNWGPHIDYIKNKCIAISFKFDSFSTGSWGPRASLLKIWYLSIIEKIICFAAGVWGNSLTLANITSLHSLQRKFLLKIARSYRTCNFQKLCILTGIFPVEYKLLFFHNKFHAWKTSLLSLPDIPPHIPLDSYINLSSFPSKTHFVDLNLYAHTTNVHIYTDGSRLEDRVGFSVCIFLNGILLPPFCHTLHPLNSVFQAEISAILLAVKWAVRNNHFVTIFSDSLSSINSLNNCTNKSSYLHSIKSFLLAHSNFFNLFWTRAHVGNYGNEVADHFAKLSTHIDNPFIVPIPFPSIKRLLSRKILSLWDTEWRNSNLNDRFYRFFPSFSDNLIVSNKYLIYFFTNHGPFPAYLHRFKLKPDPFCTCGDVGDGDHYIFDCVHTASYHLPRATRDWSLWTKQLLKSPFMTSNVTQCCIIAHNIVKSFNL